MKKYSISTYAKSLKIVDANSKKYISNRLVELGITMNPITDENLHRERIINNFATVMCQIGLQS